MKSKLKFAKSIAIRWGGSALLVSSFLALPVLADGSLIESALDSKYDGNSNAAAPTSNATQKPSSDSVGQVKSKKAAKISEPGDSNKPVVKLVKPSKAADSTSSGKSEVKLVKPAADKNTSAHAQANSTAGDQNNNVVLIPKQAPPDAENNVPEPKSALEAPIHSQIPTHHPAVPLLDFIKLGDEKVDKGFTVDPTYRGKPTLPVVPTVTFGTPSWAIPNKKKIATGVGSVPSAPVAPAGTNVGTLESPNATAPATAGTTAAPSVVKAPADQGIYDLNVRIMTDFQFSKTDTLWAYPYPPKPPAQVIANPLPQTEGQIRQTLLATGYSARPDLSRPYPTCGWRWMKAMQNSMRKAHLDYPHTMFTMYPWVNKMFPYMLSECRELNLVEEHRSQRYQEMIGNYGRSHVDLESQATGRGLIPTEIKVDRSGIAQTKLPAGSWWITCSRSYPGLKFYWQVPISCTTDKIINIQMNEANALIVAGAW